MQRPEHGQEIGRAPHGSGLVNEGWGAGVHRSRPGFVIPPLLPTLVAVAALVLAFLAMTTAAVSLRHSRAALDAHNQLVAELNAARPSPSSGLAELLDALDVPGGKLIGAAADAILGSGSSDNPRPKGKGKWKGNR